MLPPSWVSVVTRFHFEVFDMHKGGIVHDCIDTLKDNPRPTLRLAPTYTENVDCTRQAFAVC